MPIPDPASELPLRGATAQPSQPRLRIAPVQCEHREASRRLILEAAAPVRPRRGIILGAGRCEEIPLAELAAAFGHLVLNDIDRASLEAAVEGANLSERDASHVELQAADLTGVTASFAKQAAELLQTTEDAHTAVERLADVLRALTPTTAEVDEPYDLVVASCLLSQLHVPLWHRAWRLFGERFPGQEQLLQKSERLSSALEELARQMEDRLIERLHQLVTDDGRVMLSASVQCCFFKASPAGDWTTPGWYGMTRSKDLADYLGSSFEIIEQQRWPWVVTPPEITGPEGRLYHVVGAVLRRMK